MTNEEKKQLEFEIRHIFESGANEIRIYNMVVMLIERREQASKNFIKPDVIKSVCTCMAFHKSDECYKLGCKAHRSNEVQTVL